MELSLVKPGNNHTVDLEKNNQGMVLSPEIDENHIHFSDPSVGNINCSLIATSNIALFHGSIHLNNPMTLKTLASSNSLNICVMLDGLIETQFYSHQKKLNLYSNSHNSIHLIDSEGEHLLPRGQNSALHINIRSDYFFQNFHSEDLITDRLKNSIYTNSPLLISPQPRPISPQMKSILLELIKNPFKGGMKKMYLELKTFEFLMLQFLQFEEKTDSNTSLSPKERKIASDIKLLLEQNYLHTWTLDGLAQQTGTNIQTIKKAFKATFNMNVFHYYQKLRMDYAKHLLLDMDKTVAEVSDILGYSHQNHFSLAFKKASGFPPSRIKMT
jgi:AraC-like DNA-binding protein